MRQQVWHSCCDAPVWCDRGEPLCQSVTGCNTAISYASIVSNEPSTNMTCLSLKVECLSHLCLASQHSAISSPPHMTAFVGAAGSAGSGSRTQSAPSPRPRFDPTEYVRQRQQQHYGSSERLRRQYPSPHRPPSRPPSRAPSGVLT